MTEIRVTSPASDLTEEIAPTGVYGVECIGPDGKVKWSDNFRNTVTTVGKNDLLDKYLGGSSYTAHWYFGLISANSYSAITSSDTASSHAGWKEGTSPYNPTYSQSTRPAVSWASASAGAKATLSAASFSITVAGTIKGAFLINDNNKAGSNGVLYSAGLFTGGDKTVQSGDIVNLSYTSSAS